MSDRARSQVSTPEVNAVLFCRLANLVVWSQQHKDVSAKYPEFDRLVFDALTALERAGTRELPAEPPSSQQACPESEIFSQSGKVRASGAT